MISKLRIFADRLSVFIVLALTVTGLCYWLIRSFLIVSEQDVYRFADNAISGVRLSRNMDMRPPGGRVVGMNAYADFIAEATSLISTKRGGAAFIDQPLTLEERAVLDAGKALTKFRLIPESNNELLFGVQAVVRFKLRPAVGDLASIRNRWVILTDRADVRRTAFLERIDSAGVAWIRGQIPTNFFPETIEIIGPQRVRSEAVFALVTELTHAIRGGSVISRSGRLVVVRQLPYLNKIPLARKFKYFPLVGDKVRLQSGSEFKIVHAMEFDGNFVLELDRPIKPYFDSNNDIVSVVPQDDQYSGVRKLLISSLTNDHFFNGRERYFRITLDLGSNKLSGGDLILGGPREMPYVVAHSMGQNVFIDILETSVRGACTRFEKLDENYNAEIQFGNKYLSTDLLRFLDTCRQGQPKFEILRDILQNPQPSPEYNSLITNIHTRDSRSILTVSEVFYRGLDMQVHVQCAACSRRGKSEDNSVPTVEGAGDIWETYPGSALNLYYGELNKADPEMIIHALGEKSAATYYETFRKIKPSFVALTNPRQFTPWLYNWHWEFFETLLLNYREHYANSDFSLWYRDKSSWISVSDQWEGETDVSEGATEVELPIRPQDLAVYTVAIRYEVTNPFGMLPLFGKSARLLVEQSGTNIGIPVLPPASLPLSGGSYSFPVFVKSGATPILRLHLIDPFSTNVKVRVRSIAWRQVPVLSAAVGNLLYYAPPYRALALSTP